MEKEWNLVIYPNGDTDVLRQKKDKGFEIGHMVLRNEKAKYHIFQLQYIKTIVHIDAVCTVCSISS